MIKHLSVSILTLATLTGCAANTSQYAASTYNTNQLNSRQETKTVEIIAITPAQIMVDNSEQKKQAQMIGALVGAVAGGVVGHNSGSGSSSNTALGVGAGGAGGAIAGSVVKDKVETDGVSLTYKDAGKAYTSTQIGKACEFTMGIAMMLSSDGDSKETRIQPNAKCPPEPKA